ncbi:MAG: DUF4173 domain-containing protein [Clostridia bacterium]|nr:DUF4173 domain-containing protein [Clostridia bacterium]MBQ4158540.1 DUF4173 domain-containing protein [Clostridia bacterium]
MEINDLKPRKPYDKKDYIQIICACLWAIGLCLIWPLTNMPGAGISALFLITLGAVCFITPAKRSLEEKFLAVSLIAMSLWFLVFTNNRMRFINIPFTAFLMLLFMLLRTDFIQRGALSLSGVKKALRFVFPAAFTRMDAPFRMIKKSRQTHAALIGFLLSLPLMLIVLNLLSNADEVFSGMLTRAVDFISSLTSFEGILRLHFAVLVFLLSASLLQSASRGLRRPLREGSSHECPVITMFIPIFFINITYAIFISIQFLYLFGGREAAMMTGGYAQYARKGFFELAAVCMINLFLTQAVLSLTRYHKIIRIMSALTLVSTLILLISASIRMGLYISEYALSFLRLLTLWGILMMGVFTVISLIKIIRPDKKFFSLAITIAIITWMAFSWMNADGVIASVNMNRFANVSVKTVDTDYLSRLSPDAIPSLEKYENTPEVQTAIEAIKKEYASMHPFEWGFMQLNTK